MRMTFLAFAVLLTLVAKTQVSFDAGYFISNEGQKITCFIRNTDKEANPTQFQYRFSQNGAIQVGTIDSVQAFAILNTVHHYQRHTAKIERSGTDVNNLEEANNIVFKEEVLFLRVLVESQASLFIYRLANGTEKFFYRVGNGEVNPLIYYIYQGAGNAIGENQSFRQQLRNELKCPSFSQREFERLRYTEGQLTQFFARYNLCQNADTGKDIIKQKRGEHQFGLFAGVNTAALELEQKRMDGGPSSGGGSRANIERTSQKLSPVIGFSYTHILQFENGAWGLFVEPTFQVYKNKLRDVAIPSGVETELTINYTHLAVPVGVKRLFPLAKGAKFYLKGAAAWNLVFQPSAVFGTASTYRTVRGLHQDKGFAVIPGAVLGAGYLVKNKYSLEAQYHVGKTMLENVQWKARFVNSLNLLLAYRLW